MELISKKIIKDVPERKIKIMQFGEGNFLRAFVEWILQNLNDKGAIDANVVVVQPMPFGRVKELNDQNGLYTLRLEGIGDGGLEHLAGPCLSAGSRSLRSRTACTL